MESPASPEMSGDQMAPVSPSHQLKHSRDGPNANESDDAPPIKRPRCHPSNMTYRPTHVVGLGENREGCDETNLQGEAQSSIVAVNIQSSAEDSESDSDSSNKSSDFQRFLATSNDSAKASNSALGSGSSFSDLDVNKLEGHESTSEGSDSVFYRESDVSYEDQRSISSDSSESCPRMVESSQLRVRQNPPELIAVHGSYSEPALPDLMVPILISSDEDDSPVTSVITDSKDGRTIGGVINSDHDKTIGVVSDSYDDKTITVLSDSDHDKTIGGVSGSDHDKTIGGTIESYYGKTIDVVSDSDDDIICI